MFETFWYGWRIASATVGSAVLTICLLVLLIEACGSAGAWWQSRQAKGNAKSHSRYLSQTQELVSPALATDPEEELVWAAEEAQQRAVLAECERCCAAVCARCLGGEPLEWRRHNTLERWMHRGSDGTLRDCGADELRPAPLAGGPQ